MNLVREIWALAAISTLAVLLRTFAQIHIRQFAWDDIIMVAAQVRPLPIHYTRDSVCYLLQVLFLFPAGSAICRHVC